jgi:thioredoxin-related protein
VFSKIAQKFLSTDYLGKEVVYTHVAEKYMIKNMALWDSATVVRNFEYVYRMKKVLIGNTLKDLPMSDTLGKPVSLYQTKSKYILVMIYDPNCHHCQETTKKLVEDYPKLQAKGVKVFMACGVRGQEKDKKDWKKFIKDFKAQKFIHGYDNASSIDFTNDYNTQTYPNVFLLDANYKILANKKLDTEQYLNLINAEEKRKIGYRVKRHKGKDIKV